MLLSGIAIVYLILNKVNSSLREIQNVADPSYDFSYTQVHVRLCVSIFI